MKAFLLAAGVGSRLRPITDHIPKCMVPIDGTPLLDIKPFVPALDNRETERIGWFADRLDRLQSVRAYE